MSWSRALASIAIFAGLAGALSACTMAPVYSGGESQTRLHLRYAEPNSRLEQIVYQELALRMGGQADATAPLAEIAIASESSPSALSDTSNPNEPFEVELIGTLTITGANGASRTLTRSASAGFTANSQALTTQEARIDAEERAARSLAESFRLALLAGSATGL